MAVVTRERRRDNVVDLLAYKAKRGLPDAPAPSRARFIDIEDGATHVYIDLVGDKLDYGFVKVTEENALTLLEPWFYLGSELIKFYSE